MSEDLGARWLRHMRRGDFDAAWTVSDEVMGARPPGSCAHLPRHQQYVWDGRPLAGKRVLIRCYHGLGDTIQFIRFAPAVKAVATEVIVWAQPQLLPLLETMDGIDRLEPLHDGVPDVAYDVDVEVMELAHVLRCTLATLPAAVPYLHAAPAESFDDGLFHVGLVCEVGAWDKLRTIPLELFGVLADLPGVRIHLLHGASQAVRGVHVASGTDTIMGTAQLMRALDLVISVDSMPAHLAGALGVPVWTLLRKEADWRWMEDRADSPWYPTMRLFRQKRPGEWQPVITRVITALSRLGATACPSSRHQPASRAPVRL
jgi:hypothetical protein